MHAVFSSICIVWTGIRRDIFISCFLMYCSQFFFYFILNWNEYYFFSRNKKETEQRWWAKIDGDDILYGTNNSLVNDSDLNFMKNMEINGKTHNTHALNTLIALNEMWKQSKLFSRMKENDFFFRVLSFDFVEIIFHFFFSSTFLCSEKTRNEYIEVYIESCMRLHLIIIIEWIILTPYKDEYENCSFCT